MISITFPSTLPQPSVVSQQPSERRLLSSITEGLPQDRNLQRDFSGDEALQWKLTEAQMLIFMLFWTNDLYEGGRWFNATWPRVFTARTVCRFKEPPRIVLQGHEWWEVTINTELRGLSLPPLRTALLYGLHLDDDLIDVSGGSAETFDWTFGGTPISYTPGVFGDALRMHPAGNPVVSSDRGTLVLNQYGEWQISLFFRPIYNGGVAYSGGGLLSLIAWGFPTGGDIPGPGSNPPIPAQSQFELRIEGDASTVAVQFRYPSDVGTGVDENLLDKIAVGGLPTVAVDGNFHHLGIAGDATSTRMYLDGTLVADDGNYDIGSGPLRAAGTRPMWAGTAYTEQRFLIGSFFAGSFTGDYSVFPTAIDLGAFFIGDLDELEIKQGVGSVTFVGPTITVPAAPFVR